jgi:ribosomal protein S12
MLVGLRVSAPVDTDDPAIASKVMRCYCPAVGTSECEVDDVIVYGGDVKLLAGVRRE